MRKQMIFLIVVIAATTTLVLAGLISQQMSSSQNYLPEPLQTCQGEDCGNKSNGKSKSEVSEVF